MEDQKKRPPARPGSAEAERQARRAAFARAITRAELGRYYWDEGRQRELEAARKRKKPE